MTQLPLSWSTSPRGFSLSSSSSCSDTAVLVVAGVWVSFSHASRAARRFAVADVSPRTVEEGIARREVVWVGRRKCGGAADGHGRSRRTGRPAW